MATEEDKKTYLVDEADFWIYDNIRKVLGTKLSMSKQEAVFQRIFAMLKKEDPTVTEENIGKKFVGLPPGRHKKIIEEAFAGWPGKKITYHQLSEFLKSLEGVYDAQQVKGYYIHRIDHRLEQGNAVLDNNEVKMYIEDWRLRPELRPARFAQIESDRKDFKDWAAINYEKGYEMDAAKKELEETLRMSTIADLITLWTTARSEGRSPPATGTIIPYIPSEITEPVP
ncbi:MAG: hypothetical protein Q9218_002772 [Villophora microphyllina]